LVMNSSYICTHCDGIDSVVLIAERLGGMGPRASWCISEECTMAKQHNHANGRDMEEWILVPEDVATKVRKQQAFGVEQE